MATRIKWIKQRDEYSCGPVAIINILKWLGVNATYKWLPAVQNLCRCDIDGTSTADIESALKRLCIKYKKRMSPSLKKIDDHLNRNGIALVEYYYAQDEGHFALCIKKTKKQYTLVNDVKEITVSRIYRKGFIKLIRSHRVNEAPLIWFIYGNSYSLRKINGSKSKVG